jgi:hypothetical protein
VTHLPRILVAALAATFLTVPVASAQAAIAPTLSSPTNGKTVKKGGKLTFKAKLDSASEASGVFVLVSKSKKVGADGLISDDMYMRTMKRKGGSYTNTVEKYPALSSWFLNRPGKYYWQAYAIDCSDGTDDCNIESKIRSFRIK